MEILALFIIFIFIELFESKWQKSQTLHGVLLNNLFIFNKNILLYFLFNTGFIYSIFLTIYLDNYTFMMLSIVFIKFFDIGLRLSIIQKINEGIQLNEIIPDIEMKPLYRYLNVIAYPITFLFSIY